MNETKQAENAGNEVECHPCRGTGREWGESCVACWGAGTVCSCGGRWMDGECFDCGKERD